MAIMKSSKTYLMIFLATTCIYMVLYQYHAIDEKTLTTPSGSSTLGTAQRLRASNETAEQHIKQNPGEINRSSGGNENRATTSKPSTSTSVISTTSHTSSNIATSSNLIKKTNLFLWSPVNTLSMNLPRIEVNSGGKTAPTLPSPVNSMTFKFYASRIQNKLQKFLLNINTTTPAVQVLKNNQNHNQITTTIRSNINPTTSTIRSTVTTVVTSPRMEKSVTSLASLRLSSTLNPKLITLSTTPKTGVITTKNPQQSKSQSQKNATVSMMSTKPNLQPYSVLSKFAVPAGCYCTDTYNKSVQQQRQRQQHHNVLLKDNQKVVLPPLYIITPTYRRPEQLAELTRLGYTLKHVNNLLWLVIEDATNISDLVLETLNRIGVPYQYYLAPMPAEYAKSKKIKPRGVSNRNRALQWLRANATEGVFYFADDDNTYDVNIFEQMRFTKKVSMWPVGLVTKYGISTPIVRNGKLIGYYDGWIGGRKYPVDMAGFAVSVQFLLQRPKALMPYKPGYEEDGFLRSLAPLNNSEIELLANNCTEILTWHTQTKRNHPADSVDQKAHNNTNLIKLNKKLVRNGK